jgi:hypothetical protein
MVILRNYDDTSDRNTFLQIEIEHSQKPETAAFHFRYRMKYDAGIQSCSYVCDNDCSFSWFMDMAGRFQKALAARELLNNITSPGDSWKPVTWSRTDCLTALVLNDPVKSPPERFLVHLFLRPSEDHERYDFFVVRPSVSDLLSFGQEFFAELAAVPGFDPELLDDQNRW